MQPLATVADWPVRTAAVGLVAADGQVLGTTGPEGRRLALASVTKVLTAYAVLLAVEEGALGLDDAAGPQGSTVRHLLSHASGLAPNARRSVAAPGTRRIYSNAGFEWLAEHVERATGIGFADYLYDGVLAPLSMTGTRLDGSPAAGATSTLDDLLGFAAELQRPRLLHASTMAAATRVAFPGLPGVLPGFGRQPHNDWGLGFEVRDGKHPHWTGEHSSPRTFGHFGQSGTFLWVDPDAGLACVCLTDRDFGAWAKQVWPRFTDDVLADVRGRSTAH